MSKQIIITVTEEAAKNIESFLSEAIDQKEEYLANWATGDGYTEEDFRTTRESIEQARAFMSQLTTGFEETAENEAPAAVPEDILKAEDAYNPMLIRHGWVIYSANEASTMDGAGFWNRRSGWCLEEEADAFPPEWVDNYALPMSLGQDRKWLNLPLAKKTTETSLCKALHVFCDSQNLPQASADELLAGHDLEAFQARWLEQFIQQWDRVMAA